MRQGEDLRSALDTVGIQVEGKPFKTKIKISDLLTLRNILTFQISIILPSALITLFLHYICEPAEPFKLF